MSSVKAEASAASYTIIIAYSLFSTISSTTDTLAYKYIFEKTRIDKKQDHVASLAMLFIYGIGGTICLIISTFCGQGLYSMSPFTILTVILAGLFLHTALSLYMISMAIGNAGLTVSIFSSFVAMQTAISYFFLHQQITKG